MIAYSPDQILQGCPESFQGETFHEWKIKEAQIAFPEFARLLWVFDSCELEKAIEQEKSAQDLAKLAYFSVPNIVNLIITQTYPKLFNFGQEMVYKDLPCLLALIIKQNNLLEMVLRLKNSKAEAKERGEDSRNIYDIISQIIYYRLWSQDLNLLNYAEKLTYRQLEFLQERVANLQKAQMLSFYVPTVASIGQAFSSSPSQKSFEETLFTKSTLEGLNQYQINRKTWFKEEWHNKQFILEICKEKNHDINAFFPEEEIPEEFKTDDYWLIK